jgi:hypothetical protein
LILITSLSACVQDPVPLPVDADQTLDDLEDKTEYVGALLIDCSSYKGDPVDKVLLNGSRADVNPIQLNTPGFYRIEVFRQGSGRSGPDLIRIVILDAVRGNTEWALPPWTPADPGNGELGTQTVDLLHASSAPPNHHIPLVVILDKELTVSDTYLAASIGSSNFRIKRGVGSVQIPQAGSGLELTIDQEVFQLNINNIDSQPMVISGELVDNLNIQAGSYIHIPADLTIPEGITLSIESGSFITVAPEVNIYNDGLLLVTGTAQAPVTLTCSDDEAYWGGFIGRSAGNRIEAGYTIFSRSGHHTGGEYAYGHAGRQALFYSENGEFELDHCYMIDHIGQVFYPVSCSL